MSLRIGLAFRKMRVVIRHPQQSVADLLVGLKFRLLPELVGLAVQIGTIGHDVLLGGIDSCNCLMVWMFHALQRPTSIDTVASGVACYFLSKIGGATRRQDRSQLPFRMGTSNSAVDISTVGLGRAPAQWPKAMIGKLVLSSFFAAPFDVAPFRVRSLADIASFMPKSLKTAPFVLALCLIATLAQRLPEHRVQLHAVLGETG